MSQKRRFERSGAPVLALALLFSAAAACRPSAPAGEAADGPAEKAAPARAAASETALAPTAVPGNLLKNPGFEQGREPWATMGTKPWGAFDIVSHPVRSGLAAAYLPVEAGTADDAQQHVKVYGVVQEPTEQPFPERVSGWYRVESWEPGDPRTDLYLQFVVIVWGDPRTDELVHPGKPPTGLKNYQIRYYLAGLEEPPFRLANARLRFLGKGPPELGKWIHFQVDLAKEFEELWGVVPRDYEFVRVLFEARWDNRPPGVPVRCDTYYDDLYLGPAQTDPNASSAIR